jgi:hypothetical protein
VVSIISLFSNSANIQSKLRGGVHDKTLVAIQS